MHFPRIPTRSTWLQMLQSNDQAGYNLSSRLFRRDMFSLCAGCHTIDDGSSPMPAMHRRRDPDPHGNANVATSCTSTSTRRTSGRSSIARTHGHTFATTSRRVERPSSVSRNGGIGSTYDANTSAHHSVAIVIDTGTHGSIATTGSSTPDDHACPGWHSTA